MLCTKIRKDRLSVLEGTDRNRGLSDAFFRALKAQRRKSHGKRLSGLLWQLVHVDQRIWYIAVGI